jgi:uncharacterized RDD family membrane protein YckC
VTDYQDDPGMSRTVSESVRDMGSGGSVATSPAGVFGPSAAPIWCRPLRFLVDDFLWALVAALVIVPVETVTSSAWWSTSLWLAVGIVVIVVPVARTGQSAGGVLTRTRVVRIDRGTSPGFTASLVRWVVPLLPWFAAGVVYRFGLDERAGVWVSLAGLVAFAAVYVGVLVDRDRRGVQDRLAGTVVVRPVDLTRRRHTR